MLQEIKVVDDFTKKKESESNDYMDSLLYTKTCASNCTNEEDALVQVYKNYILEEFKP